MSRPSSHDTVPVPPSQTGDDVVLVDEMHQPDHALAYDAKAKMDDLLGN